MSGKEKCQADQGEIGQMKVIGVRWKSDEDIN
jgi:hypothetical protein